MSTHILPNTLCSQYNMAYSNVGARSYAIRGKYPIKS